MRDEKRIDKILDKIRDTWKQNPDMRLGQLLINMCLIPDDNRVWNIEDNKTEYIIDKNYNKLRR